MPRKKSDSRKPKPDNKPSIRHRIQDGTDESNRLMNACNEIIINQLGQIRPFNPSQSTHEIATSDSDVELIVPEKKRGAPKKVCSGVIGEHYHYKLTQLYQECNHSGVIYGVAFNDLSASKNGQDLFATCGDNCVTVYRYDRKTHKFVAHCSYSAPRTKYDNHSSLKKDKKKLQEVFYSCVWACDRATGNQYVLAAGQKGVIHIIDVQENAAKDSNMRHDDSINALTVCRWNTDLLLSAGYDRRIFLWNIPNRFCIAKFGGTQGHADYVVSVDFHPTLHYFASAGADRAVMIWSLKEVAKEFEVSSQASPLECANRVPPKLVLSPVFSTRSIHTSIVDTVMWINDILVTRSCGQENDGVRGEIVIWKPGTHWQDKLSDFKYGSPSGAYDDSSQDDKEDNKENSQEGSNGFTAYHDNYILDAPPYNILMRIPVAETGFWFMRFGMDMNRKLLAMGNNDGDLFVYSLRSIVESLDEESFLPIEPTIISPYRHKRLTIRQVAFNHNATKMVLVTDKCNVVVYNLVKK